MSETRHRCVALVLAAHGDRGVKSDLCRVNATLLSHRDALSTAVFSRELATGPAIFTVVTAGVLKGDPAIENALAAAHRSGAEKIFVYPFFMADGYFVRSVLPTRIAAAGLSEFCQLLPPLGVDTALVPLIHSSALGTALAAGLNPKASRLLVVGHGSELGPASANATSAAVEFLRSLGTFAEVQAAFLEEPPFLADELSGQRPPTIVAGFFSGDGLHAGEDVPSAIRETGANAIYCGPIGAAAEVPALILSAALLALATP